MMAYFLNRLILNPDGKDLFYERSAPGRDTDGLIVLGDSSEDYVATAEIYERRYHSLDLPNPYDKQSQIWMMFNQPDGMRFDGEARR